MKYEIDPEGRAAAAADDFSTQSKNHRSRMKYEIDPEGRAAAAADDFSTQSKNHRSGMKHKIGPEVALRQQPAIFRRSQKIIDRV